MRSKNPKPAPAATGNRLLLQADRLGSAISFGNKDFRQTREAARHGHADTQARDDNDLGGRAGNAAICTACSAPLHPKPGSRRQRYCGAACRQAGHRRALKRAGQAKVPLSRSTEISPPISSSVPMVFTDQVPRVNAVPRAVIEVELIAGRDWHEMTSADGAICAVAGGSA
jgi:hypothetical protein